MFSQRLRQIRMARGLSLEEVAAAVGGVVTRQAIWKYEQGKAQPSSVVANHLALALGVKSSSLWTEPTIAVKFVAYRKRSGLLKREQDRLTNLVILTLEERVRLQDIIQEGNGVDLPVQALSSHTIGEAETAAGQLRDRWNLGTDPISSMTDCLENHRVHVIEIEAADKFDGISAFAYETQEPRDHVVAAAIVTRKGIPGERQRLDLAHELGHLVLNVPGDVDEERAAFRFAGAFLAPAETLRREIGRKRAYVTMQELLLQKRRYGMSVQALLHRLRDLEIISDSHYTKWCIDISRLGYRKKEPNEIPSEQPQWLRRSVLRAVAEGLMSVNEAESLMGEKVEGHEPLSLIERRAFLKLPVEERRRMLAEQADAVVHQYEEDQDWKQLEGGDIVEY